jgi:two-component system sensor histidine kinase HydH
LGLNNKKFVWYSITFAIIISLAIITLEIYNIEERNIKNSVLQNQIKIQEIITKSISKNISSELELIVFELDILSKSDEIQNDIGTTKSNEMLNDTFNRLNMITPSARILALDKNFMVSSQVSKSHESVVGRIVTGLSEIIDNEESDLVEPKILSISTLLFEEPEVAIIVPIINSTTDTLKGSLLVTLSSSEFFERHGNIYDIESQFLMVIDEHNTLLVHPKSENIGKNFFGNEIQKNVGDNTFLNPYILSIFQGNPSTTIFTLDDGIGERIHSGVSVKINEKNEFLFAVVTPTQSINEEIDEVIFFTKIQTTFLLLSTIVVLLVFLMKRTQSFKKEKLAVIGKLSSNIAHDIRNPLGTIKNAGVIIDKENKKENEVISREINRINISVRRISHQIEEVLNYVRTTPIILKSHSINKTIQEAVDTLNPSKNIQLDLPQKDLMANFDYEKMLIVFVNILLNAVQSIGEDRGKISINTYETSTDTIIKFENSGPNIPAKELEKVFDTLFTTKLEGTGLGLSSCKNIIEQHRGEIKVSNNPVVFSIRIPK